MMRRRNLGVVLVAVLVLCGSVCTGENLVVNGGFEISEDTDGGWPSSYGHWHGDYSSIVGPTNGITPLDGSRMLQFKGSSFGSGARSADASQVPQIVDVSEFASQIASGNVVVSASGYFNRVTGDGQTDTKIGFSVFAYKGSPSSYPAEREAGRWLARANAFVYTDSDPTSWESAELQMVLPTSTDYVVIEVSARENVYNDRTGTEFDGHFADSVSLTIGNPGVLQSIEIVGPNEVAENSQAQYTAIAHYDNNSTADVTGSADWWVDPNGNCKVVDGLLTIERIDLPEDVTITAAYSEGDVNEVAEKDVSIFAICPSGNALEFDGVDDYVEVPDDDSLTPSHGLTICAWVYINQISWNDRIAIVNKYNYASGDRAYLFDLGKNNNPDKSTVCFGVSQTRTPFNGKITCGTTPLEVGQWYHIAATFEPNHQEIYVNGIEQTDEKDTAIADSIPNNYVPLHIGYSSNEAAEGGNGFFNGKIDEVTIYDRRLSAEEIRALMHIRPGSDEPNLVGYWDFDEGEGPVAGDSAGGNDGTIVGATWTDTIAPVGICTLEDLVERNLIDVWNIKQGILDELEKALDKEEALLEMLNTCFDNRDFGTAKKGDVVKAKQKIDSAIQCEVQAEDAVDKSLEKLGDALTALDIELDTDGETQE